MQFYLRSHGWWESEIEFSHIPAIGKDCALSSATSLQITTQWWRREKCYRGWYKCIHCNQGQDAVWKRKKPALHWGFSHRRKNTQVWTLKEGHCWWWMLFECREAELEKILWVQCLQSWCTTVSNIQWDSAALWFSLIQPLRSTVLIRHLLS